MVVYDKVLHVLNEHVFKWFSRGIVNYFFNIKSAVEPVPQFDPGFSLHADEKFAKQKAGQSGE